jgi:hypothetical protein
MRTPLLLFLFALSVFAAFAGPRLKIHSQHNHFVYLADSFLHGQLELTREPPSQNDWASFDVLTLKGASKAAHGDQVRGFFTRRSKKPNEFQTLKGDLLSIPKKDRGAKTTQRYVSFPPMPAVVMMPSVALLGYGTNDVVLTVFFAALNVMLMFLLLERLRKSGYTARSPSENLWLTALFGFGTAHLWCAALGQVWFTALIFGVTFHLLYLLFAIDARRPWLAGLMLAFAFATRASLLFTAVFFYWQLFWPAHGQTRTRSDLIKRFVAFSLPPLAMGLTLMAYNYARFESITEFGHTYLAGGHLARVRDFGLFNGHFLNRNLTALLTLLPRPNGVFPYFQISKHGMSIFLSTPAVLLLFWPVRTHRLAKPMAVTAFVILVPILFYQNTGWSQFSFRFALDFLPLVVGLLAIGGRPMNRLFKGLILAGILVNALGAGTFQRKVGGKIYTEFQCPEPRR